jgi:hypothetical protein
VLKTDPVEKIEMMVRELNDRALKYAKPVQKRYPLLLGFLFTLSLAAFFQGFEIFANNVPFFERHPFSLMAIGIVMLLLTGGLYKALQKPD